jgi:hemerythrin-like domain-containing protein
MEAKGFSRDCGPTGVMLREHELGRQHVGQMNDALAAAQAGDSKAIGRFVEHAREFIALLREHIHKEDHCLFSMADQAFSAADQQQLLDAFARVEAEHMGVGTHEKYLQIADELADRFGVTHAASAAGCHSCCGH